MSKRESISRYSLIIKKLRRNPSTFTEISDHLNLESEFSGYNYNVSKRTFQRDLEDIRSLYNIEIRYDFSRKVYFIESEEDPEKNQHILEAFDTLNALNLNDRLSDFVHFEKRKPKGTEHFLGLLHAIKNHIQIKLEYQKFGEDETSGRIVEPYALKEFRNRWYVLAKESKDTTIKSFALDRLSELEITNRKFQSPVDFNVNEHFRYCFGIISPNEHKPEKVVLSFDPYQGKYIKTLPLHHSQEILLDNEKELRIQLTLFITQDFLMEVLSYGDNVKVIEPISFKNDLKSIIQKSLNLYS